MSFQRHRKNGFDRAAAPLRDNHGVAMIEFALIVPFLVVTHVAGSYFADINMANNKVTRAAQTLASIIAQESEVETSEVTGILNASRAVMDPIGGNSSLRVTAVRFINGSWNVRWSDAIGTVPALTYNTTFQMDAAALAGFKSLPTTRSVLVADVTVNYSSGLARMWNSLAWMPFKVNGTSVLSDRAFALQTRVAASGALYNGSTTDSSVRLFDSPTGGPLGTGRVW